jgi:hypothetical protein
MSSIPCSQCGLVNFLTAERCKRCKATLSAPPTLTAPPTDKPRPTLSKSLSQYAGSSERQLPHVSEGVRDTTEPRPRMRLSPLRILVVILLLLGASWYQMQKWDAERAVQLQADKEFDEKQRQLLNNLH